MIVAPSALATSSTASSAVVFSRSRIGFTSTTSSEPARPDSATSSIARWGLTVRQSTLDRRTDPRRDLRIERIHVEADVDEARSGEVIERLTDGALDTNSIEVAHREDARVQRPKQLALTPIEGADADERDPLDGRQVPRLPLELAAGEPECGRQRHPVNVAARGGLRSV